MKNIYPRSDSWAGNVLHLDFEGMLPDRTAVILTNVLRYFAQSLQVNAGILTSFRLLSFSSIFFQLHWLFTEYPTRY